MVITGATPQPMEEVRDGDEGEVEEDYEYEEEEFEVSDQMQLYNVITLWVPSHNIEQQ